MRKIWIFFCIGICTIKLNAQSITAGLNAVESSFQHKTYQFNPLKILWQSDSISNSHFILRSKIDQATAVNAECFKMVSNEKELSILLDFGKELNGSVSIISNNIKNNLPARFRIRFGESVGEAMAEIDTIHNATNDHAIRDYQFLLPWKGKIEIGNTGFRFVRLDFLDKNSFCEILSIRANLKIRDIEYKGTFACSDTLLNKIWDIGAYTVHLNMQDYLWDGIKRDRLVWSGDLYVENLTVNTVFGYNDIVPSSLDLIRDQTPLPEWMHGLSTSSMWWVQNQYLWYSYHADHNYLEKQRLYLTGLLKILLTKVGETGYSTFEWGFIDWPSTKNNPAALSATNALLLNTIEKGAYLLSVLNEDALAAKCFETVELMRKKKPEIHNQKQEAAILSLSGLADPILMNEIIKKDSTQNFSTFFGYFMLEAMAKVGDYNHAMEFIKQYWGKMIELGATTFWEQFELNWALNANKISQMPEAGKIDLHGTYGDFCYIKYRNSLCHGWASGPTPWLTQHVLGINVVKPGCKEITIKPHLGDLKWAMGTFPTPFGVIHIKHERLKNNEIKTTCKAPKGIKVKVIND